MRWPQILRLGVVLLVLLVAAAFTVQNVSRTSMLSLDLYVYAWRLDRPVPVPWLIWGSFGAGLVLSGLVGWVRRRALRQTVARLEQEALLRSAGRPASSTPTPEAPPTDDWGR